MVNIGKSFESCDGQILKNRVMCIFSIENGHLMLMPMSTFHNQEAKVKKMNMSVNFEYSKIHGNNRDGYIKCDQIYVLSEENFNKFDEIKLSRRMNKEVLEKLQNHVKNLQKDSKTRFFKKEIIFKDSPELVKKEQVKKQTTKSEVDYER